MDYVKALQALHFLLISSGEKHWAAWIKRDIELWERNHEVSHHLSAYGGMGSFNDIWICEGNGHTISKFQEPWINYAIDELKAISFSFARFGEMRTTPRRDSVLQGYRCLECGYSEITEYDMECYIAKRVVGERIVAATDHGDLMKVVREIYALEIVGLEVERETVKKWALGSFITVTKRTGWMRPCAKCNHENTAVYRWILKERKRLFNNRGYRFVPTEDNLPLVKRG